MELLLLFFHSCANSIGIPDKIAKHNNHHKQKIQQLIIRIPNLNRKPSSEKEKPQVQSNKILRLQKIILPQYFRK